MERGATQSKSFQVFVRLCCQEQRGSKTGKRRSVLKVKGGNQVVVDPGKGHQPHTLLFDAVWDETATQRDVYESTVRPLVQSLLLGYNGCVITYGPLAGGPPQGLLGSGTCVPTELLNWAAEHIFSSPQAGDRRIRVSFMHISNEKIYDLLSLQDSPPAEVCRIREGDNFVVLEGLNEVEVDSAQSLLQLYRRGAASRHSGVSRGEFASRSHVIFNVSVISRRPYGHHGQKGLVTGSKLTLVDIASPAKPPPHGSPPPERNRRVQAVQENPQEAKILKRSLAIFGNVIRALGTPGCHHVPYRESKLTRILRDCLGGKCRTSLVVTVSPNPSSIREALSCLRFASRAMAIRELRCCPLQTRGAAAMESPKHGPARHAAHLAPTARGKVYPPTHRLPSLYATARPARLSLKCQDNKEQKSFLPPLDKAAPGAGQASPSCSLLGVQDLEASGRERQAGPTGGTADCPTCQREQAIRQGYDKYIVQVNKEREDLGQQVALLEARLRSRTVEEQCQEPAGAPGGPRTQSTETVAVCEERLQREKEELQEDCREGKEIPGGGGQLRCRAELELQDLKVQWEKDRLLLHCLKEQKETLSAELKDTKGEFERFKESVALTVAQLHKEKEKLLLQIQEEDICHEKVVAENASLREKVKELLNEAGSRRFSPAPPNQLNSSTAMLFVSHEVSECCPEEFWSQSSAPYESSSSPLVVNDYVDGLLRMKDLFRQLRREHSLLRDVMLVSYRRRWFREDAVPYIKRTLIKCGMQLDLLDWK